MAVERRHKHTLMNYTEAYVQYLNESTLISMHILTTSNISQNNMSIIPKMS